MPSTTGRRSVKHKKILCGQCKLEVVENKDDFIECDNCSKIYHARCEKIDKKRFEHLLKNKDEEFLCQFCSGVNKSNIEKQLHRMEEKLNNIDRLMESVEFMSSKFENLMKNTFENSKRIENVEKENVKLKGEVKTLQETVKMLNDHRVKKDCIINGISVQENKNAVETVIEISETVGVEISESNIDEAYFLKKNNSNNKKQSLIVKFNTKSTKDKLMEAKNKLKNNDNTKQVYINDLLSKESLELFNYAKSLKTVGYNYIFTKGSRIFVKKSAINKPKIIHTKEDVDEILLEATTTNLRSRRSMRLLHASDDDTDDNDGQAAFVSPDQRN
ncbi:uncharacterized protein [Musca autumnalis]|uniref:uncharacterized protein n=1 Tax=Musca autumnalis TaxID=221902 RepID=UPI003CE6CA46